MSRLEHSIMFGAAGALLGAVSGVYSAYQAKAAVEVRPRLADVGFVDAFLANHGGDWLFYHYPEASIIVYVVILAVLAALVPVKT